MSCLNVAAYKFVELDRLEARRAVLHASCTAHSLKGTILLAREGINLFLAGSHEGVDSLLDTLRAWPGLEDIEVKESTSETQPFRRPPGSHSR